MKTVLVCALLVMAGLEGALGWDQELGWDQDELDLFDLVEEVGENFYSLLQVEEVGVAYCGGNIIPAFSKPEVRGASEVAC